VLIKAAVIKWHINKLPANGNLKPVKAAMYMQPAAFSHLVDIVMPAKAAVCASLGIHCTMLIGNWQLATGNLQLATGNCATGKWQLELATGKCLL